MSFLNRTGVKLWWYGEVLSIQKATKYDDDDLAAIGKLRYPEQRGHKMEVREVGYRHDGMLRHTDSLDNTDRVSQWRYQPSASGDLPATEKATNEQHTPDIPGHSAGLTSTPRAATARTNRSTRAAARARRSAAVSSPPGPSTGTVGEGDTDTPSEVPWIPRSSGRQLCPSEGASLPSNRRTAVTDETVPGPTLPSGAPSLTVLYEHIRVLTTRVDGLESRQDMFERQDHNSLKSMVTAETRLDAKVGISDEIMRKLRPLSARRNGCQYDATLQFGFTSARCNCPLFRFKILARAVHDRYVSRPTTRGTISSVQGEDIMFTPAYHVITGPQEFPHAEIRFASALQLFEFLGFTDRAEMWSLIHSRPEENDGTGRILGGVRHHDSKEGKYSLFFPGFSCMSGSPQQSCRNGSTSHDAMEVVGHEPLPEDDENWYVEGNDVPNRCGRNSPPHGRAQHDAEIVDVDAVADDVDRAAQDMHNHDPTDIDSVQHEHAGGQGDGTGAEASNLSGTTMRISTASWDEENRCFGTAPSLVSDSPDYRTDIGRDMCCFRIRWVTEKVKFQRSAKKLNVDREGMRRGELHVDCPHILFGNGMTKDVEALLRVSETKFFK